MLFMMATKLNAFYKNNQKCEDVKTVQANLLQVLKQTKTQVNLDNQHDQEEIQTFVTEKYSEISYIIANGIAEPSSIKQCLNVAYLIDILEQS